MNCTKHPTRKAKTRGLCNSCYIMWLSNNNPKYKETRRKAKERYYKNNREKELKNAKEWAQRNPERKKTKLG